MSAEVIDLVERRAERMRDRDRAMEMHPSLRWIVAGSPVAHRRNAAGEVACGAGEAQEVAVRGLPPCSECFGVSPV